MLVSPTQQNAIVLALSSFAAAATSAVASAIHRRKEGAFVNPSNVLRHCLTIRALNRLEVDVQQRRRSQYWY